MQGGAGAAPLRFERVSWDQRLIPTYGVWAVATIETPILPVLSLPLVPDAAPTALEPAPTSGESPRALPPVIAQGPSPAAISVQEIEALKAAEFKRGHDKGIAEGRAAAEAALARELALLRELGRALQTVQDPPEQLHAPLKRLAIHIAKELVRGELTISSQAVDRLVRRCLAEVDHAGKPVVVVLNPQDRERLLARDHAMVEPLRFEAEERLSPGSVEVRVNDLLVQDLIENRLHAIARSLLAEPESWLDASSWLRAADDSSAADSDLPWADRLDGDAGALGRRQSGTGSKRPGERRE